MRQKIVIEVSLSTKLLIYKLNIFEAKTDVIVSTGIVEFQAVNKHYLIKQNIIFGREIFWTGKITNL